MGRWGDVNLSGLSLVFPVVCPVNLLKTGGEKALCYKVLAEDFPFYRFPADNVEGMLIW